MFDGNPTYPRQSRCPSWPVLMPPYTSWPCFCSIDGHSWKVFTVVPRCLPVWYSLVPRGVIFLYAPHYLWKLLQSCSCWRSQEVIFSLSVAALPVCTRVCPHHLKIHPSNTPYAITSDDNTLFKPYTTKYYGSQLDAFGKRAFAVCGPLAWDG